MTTAEDIETLKATVNSQLFSHSTYSTALRQISDDLNYLHPTGRFAGITPVSKNPDRTALTDDQINTYYLSIQSRYNSLSSP